MHSEFAYEQEKFNSTLAYLRDYYEVIRGEKEKINSNIEVALKHYNSENIDQFNELVLHTSKHEFLDQKVKIVGRSLSNPYFARVDFIPNLPDEEAKQRIYIGKFTLFDKSGLSVLITDWRAPISTLYYEGRVGEASYNCPDGDIDGEITLKRQYITGSGKLLDIMDIDITTNDEFLQAALGSSKDKRLKDIVTTIQAEQNRIIRAEMFRPLIVQGAAGSGKTTIALHRIAYLLYAYEDSISPKNIMIMAPNKFFLSYISDVLPDLGVDNVIQTTFEDFAKNFLSKKIKIKSAVHVLAEAIENHVESNCEMAVSSLKSTLKYRLLLERYCDLYIRTFIPKSDFDIEGYVLIKNERIREYILNDYSYLPILKRVSELKKNLTSALGREKERILNFINTKYDIKRNDIKREMEDCGERRKIITQILDERDRKLKDVKKIINNRIKEYIAGFKIISADRMYLSLINNVKLFNSLAANIFSKEECKEICEVTQRYTKNGFVEIDDVAPLLYLQYRLYGSGEKMELKHVVIDEAQDYSLFQFSVLRDILGVNSFSVLGDINQGIYAYRGVKSWSDVSKQSFSNPEYMTLEQSYRTTIEIMNAANGVIDHLYAFGGIDDIRKAKPVIRSGGDVIFRQETDAAEIAEKIDLCISECEENGFRSIAVICKTRKGCQALGKRLKKQAYIIKEGDNDYRGGVLLTPSYLVKGLEFDAVILADASSENYGINPLDIKLLYVAMTRALHKLFVYYSGEISPLLTTSL